MYFSRQLIAWYHENRRDLPWRKTNDPYVIWLSEVILQQTRVNQGLAYFHKFLDNYPDVNSFASASEGEILRHWQGLGYYSRARNMLKAATIIVKEYNGIFPSTFDELIKLPGIGEYTASAIASFCANEAKAVVDGNVYRVLSRYFGIEEPINSTTGKKQFQELAQEILLKEDPGTHNQAIMEFGALQCKPQRPDCEICPLHQSCFAIKNQLVHQLPVKIKAGKSRDRYFNYFVIREEDKILMQKRGSGDIWENLFELPLLESPELFMENDPHANEVFRATFGERSKLIYKSEPIKHVLSHQNIHARFFEIKNIHHGVTKNTNWNYVLIKDLDKLAKSKLTYSFLEKYLI